MRLYVELGDRSETVAFIIDDPAATVRDLTEALGLPSPNGVVVDGRYVGPSIALGDAGLVEGSVVEPVDPDRVAMPAADVDVLRVGVVAGPDAGSVAVVHSGRFTIGRGHANDLTLANETVSTEHAALHLGRRSAVRLEDLDSHNGTWLLDRSVDDAAELEPGDRFRLGSSVLRIDVATVADRPVGIGPGHADDRGRILFNRPPRRLVPGGAVPVVVPSTRPERRSPVFSLVALVVPILFAVVMIQVTGRWQYAMFALLSPLMFIGNYISGRRRVRRERKQDDETYADGLARLRRELSAAVEHERSRRTAIAPDMVEVRRRVELPSSRLWERRPGSVDAMTVGLGRGELHWEPPLHRSNADVDDVIEAVVADHRTISDVELLVDLRQGPVGLVGDDVRCRAAARSLLLQLATHHGPADLSIAVLTSEANMSEWSWAQWLPHVSSHSGGVQIFTSDAASAFSSSLLEHIGLADSSPHGADAPMSPGWLLIVDDIALLHGRSSPTRRLLSNAHRHVFGIVIASTEDQLPAATATIAELGDNGVLTRREPGSTAEPSVGIADLTSIEVAGVVARSLARFEDPELRVAGGNLPPTVRPRNLWGDEMTSVESVRRQWSDSKRVDALAALVGIGEDGPLTLDLVHDGPHGLVAGTTGAGKSEFLRTLVVGLARSHDPDDLVFVLIDYKGGSAFDCCSKLPHVVGMVTDLDDHLAARALRSLEAELHHRERLFREAETSDISGYRKAGSPRGPLPRLVVIIDEFATLRTELPDFVAALVGVAQRGRSLGVHLILATQRPSGAVDANIRANTNLRVALRVQDSADSTDVIDTKEAALIDRSTPGRAFVRRGQGDLAAIQTAYLSGPHVNALGTPIRTAAVPIGTGAAPRFPSVDSESDVTDLEVLVGTITAAASGFSRPRRPWLDDLEPTLTPADVDGLESGDGAPVVLAIGDDPDRQRRTTLGWNPDEGHLLVYGVLGSGVTTLLRSLIHRIGPGVRERPAWVFCADHGASGLAGINELDHVSCCLDAIDGARHDRLLAMLGEMLDARRTMSADSTCDLPLVVVVVDGLASFCKLTGTGNAGETSELFNRIVRDGPSVGIVIVAGVNRVGEVPRSLAATARRHFVMELADPSEYQTLGIKARSLPTFRPGRALVGPAPTVTQVIDWSTAPLGNGHVLGHDVPPAVEKLPDRVRRTELDEHTLFEPDVSIPFGIDDESRAVTRLVLRGGEHALIAGPSRSGRTTALLTIARQLRDADPGIVLVGVAPRVDAGVFDAEVFDAAGTVGGLDNVLEMAKSDPRRWMILVDDADQIDMDDGPLLDIVRNARDGLHVIAAGRSSTMRQAYGHWLRHVRASGLGLILNPDNGVDGELLTVRLPRGVRLPELPGRGYLVRSGVANVVQVSV